MFTTSSAAAGKVASGSALALALADFERLALLRVVGFFFGLPSSRIKGFYLMVTTLAAQFFLEWLFVKFPWFYNYGSSGTISAPKLALFGHDLNTPLGRYWLTRLRSRAEREPAKRFREWLQAQG